MSKQSYEEIREAYRKEAAETLEFHEYTQLVNQDGCEVWRCQNGSSTIYAFDIMMTRFGIAIVGDIDNMTFRVGSSYGIAFLAGDDVGYYIHSKLDDHCKERELDAEILKSSMIEWIKDHVEQKFPEWYVPAFRPDQTSEFSVWLHAKWYNMAESDHRVWDWYHLLDQVDDLICGNDIHAVHTFLNENSQNLCEEWWDHTFTKPSESLMHRLYMVNHAAKEIMKIKGAANG